MYIYAYIYIYTYIYIYASLQLGHSESVFTVGRSYETFDCIPSQKKNRQNRGTSQLIATDKVMRIKHV